jgi:hypothetical protein
MLPESSTLADLFAVCGSSRFRVRHIDTLEDYSTLSIKSYNPAGYPSWFGALRLDGGLQDCDLNGQWAKYALLSSLSECRYLNSLLDGELRRYFKNYPNPPIPYAPTCECEDCQFGEG